MLELQTTALISDALIDPPSEDASMHHSQRARSTLAPRRRELRFLDSTIQASPCDALSVNGTQSLALLFDAALVLKRCLS